VTQYATTTRTDDIILAVTSGFIFCSLDGMYMLHRTVDELVLFVVALHNCPS
jgi:hypothetical protein